MRRKRPCTYSVAKSIIQKERKVLIDKMQELGGPGNFPLKKNDFRAKVLM